MPTILCDLLQYLYAQQTVEDYDASPYLRQLGTPEWAAHAKRHKWVGSSAFGSATTAVSIEDGLLLYALVLATKPRLCVEVGRCQGLSTCMIAAALAQNGEGTLISIDTDSNSTQDALANLERFGLREVVQVHVGNGALKMQEVLPQAGPVDFFFEDANHDTSIIVAHVGALRPYLNVPAYLAFHDSIVLASVSEGIQKSVDMLGRDNVEQMTVGTWRGITVLRRHKES